MKDSDVAEKMGAHTEAILTLKESSKSNAKKIEKIYVVVIINTAVSAAGAVAFPEAVMQLVASISKLFV